MKELKNSIILADIRTILSQWEIDQLPVFYCNDYKFVMGKFNGYAAPGFYAELHRFSLSLQLANNGCWVYWHSDNFFCTDPKVLFNTKDEIINLLIKREEEW